jgi:hypothetical protein
MSESNIESVQYCCSLDFVLSNNVDYVPVRRERLPFRTHNAGSTETHIVGFLGKDIGFA